MTQPSKMSLRERWKASLLQEYELREKLANVSAFTDAIRLAIVKEDWGIDVGSVVIRKGSEYSVTRVETKWIEPFHRDENGVQRGEIPTPCRQPWVHGKARRKDGEWSKRETCLYSEWRPLQLGSPTFAPPPKELP